MGSVDDWLRYSFHQIFGDGSVKFPRSRVSRHESSPLEGRMWRDRYRCKSRRRPVADRTLGNSVGAIESVARSVVASCSCSACGWDRFGVSLLFGSTLRPLLGVQPTRFGAAVQDSYLVDSASSHMLVSKIKPCMSKYKQLYRETANGSLNQLSFI